MMLLTNERYRQMRATHHVLVMQRCKRLDRPVEQAVEHTGNGMSIITTSRGMRSAYSSRTDLCVVIVIKLSFPLLASAR